MFKAKMLLIAVAVIGVGRAFATAYSITDLGTFTPVGINNAGQVAGYAQNTGGTTTNDYWYAGLASGATACSTRAVSRSAAALMARR